MCISMILGIAGAAMSAVGAMQQAKAQQAQADYNAQVQRNNQIIAQQNADVVRKQARVAVQDQRRKLVQNIGTARAVMASKGLLVDDYQDSTSQALLDDITTAGAADIMTLKYNAELEERRALIQKNEFKAREDLFDMEKRSINPTFAALTAGVGGLSRNYDLIR